MVLRISEARRVAVNDMMVRAAQFWRIQVRSTNLEFPNTEDPSSSRCTKLL